MAEKQHRHASIQTLTHLWGKARGWLFKRPPIYQFRRPLLETLEDRLAPAGVDYTLLFNQSTQTLQLLDNNNGGQLVQQGQLSDPDPFLIAGTAEADLLTIDYSIPFAHQAGVRFEGNDANDRLAFVGGSVGVIASDSTGGAAGRLTFDGSRFSYGGVEEVDVGLTADTQTVNLSSGDTAAVQMASTSGQFDVTIGSTTTKYQVPTSELSIQGPGNQSDAITVNLGDLDLQGASLSVDVTWDNSKISSPTPDSKGFITLGEGATLSTRATGANDPSTADSGAVTLKAGSITLGDSAAIYAQVEQGSTFTPGEVVLAASNDLPLDSLFLTIENNTPVALGVQTEVSLGTDVVIDAGTIDVSATGAYGNPDSTLLDDSNQQQGGIGNLQSEIVNVSELISLLHLPVAVVLEQTQATVTVNGGASLTASGDLSLEAGADSAALADATWMFTTSKSPGGIAFLYAQADATAEVTLASGAMLDAGGDIALRSDARTRIEGTSQVAQAPGKTVSTAKDVDVSAAVGFSDTTSHVTVAAGAGITAAGNVNIDALGHAHNEVTTRSTSYDGGLAGVTFTYLRPTSDIQASVAGSITAGGATVVAEQTINPFLAVDAAHDTIDLGSDAGYQTGDEVVYASAFGGPIDGLEDGGRYFVIVDGSNPNLIQLAASRADALAGTALDLGGNPSLTDSNGTATQFTRVDAVANQILFDFDPGFQTGEALVYTAAAGKAIGGLTDGTTYYAIVDSSDSTRVQLAATRADAQASTPVAIDLSLSPVLVFTATANPDVPVASVDDSSGTLFLDLPSVTTTGDLAATSDTVSNVASTDGLKVGQTVSGDGIAPGTTLTQIDGSTLTLSQKTTNTSATTGVSLTFTDTKAIFFGLITHTTTGDLTEGNAEITVASTDGLQVGQAVSGTGVPDNTTLVKIDGTTLTLSNKASESISGTELTFTDTLNGRSVVYRGALGLDLEGLVDGTTYYIIDPFADDSVVEPDGTVSPQVRLAASMADAIASDGFKNVLPFVIDDTLTTGAAHTLSPAATSGIGITASLISTDLLTNRTGIGLAPAQQQDVTNSNPDYEGNDGETGEAGDSTAGNSSVGTGLPEGTSSGFPFELTVAFEWLQVSNTVLAEVGADAVLESSGDVTVDATLTQRSGTFISAGGSKQPDANKTTVDVAAAGSFAEFDNSVQAVIRGGASVDASGDLDVSSEVVYPLLTPLLVSPDTLAGQFHDAGDSVADAKTFLQGFFSNVTPFSTKGFTSWDLAQAQLTDPSTEPGATSVSVGGSVSWSIYDNTAEAIIEQGALINQDTSLQTDTQSVSVTAATEMLLVGASGVIQPQLDGFSMGRATLERSPTLNDPTEASAKTAGAGGALFVLDITNTTTAAIGIPGSGSGDGVAAQVRVGDQGTLTVEAEHTLVSVSWAQSATDSEKFGVAGGMGFYLQSSTTTAEVASGTQVTGGSMSVTADDSTSYGSMVGGVQKGANLGIGFSGAYFDINRTTEAFIGDAAGTSTDASTIDLSGDLTVRATSTGGILGFALASDTISENDDSPSDGSGTAKQDVPEAGQDADPDNPTDQNPGSYGVAISGDFVVFNVEQTLTQAFIDDPGTVEASAITLSAANDTNYVAGSGSSADLTGNLDSSKNVGLAGSASVVLLDAETTAAYVHRVPNLTASAGLMVSAASSGAVLSHAAGGVGAKKTNAGGFDLAGSAAVNILTSLSTLAYLESVGTSDTPVLLGADSSLTATDNLRTEAIAGATEGGGKLGIGTAVAWNEIDSTSQATLSGSFVQQNAGSLSLSATVNTTGDAPNPTTRMNAAASSSATSTAQSSLTLAGTIAVNLANTNTSNPAAEATITGTTYTGPSSDGGLTLSAEDGSSLLALAGALASGTSADAGFAVAYNQLNNATTASIGSSSSITLPNGDTSLQAVALNELNGYALGSTNTATQMGQNQDKTTSLAGSAAANETNRSVTAANQGGAVITVSGGNVSIQAEVSDVAVVAGAGDLSGTSGTAPQNTVGAAVAVNDLTDTILAENTGTGTKIDASGSVDISASSNGTQPLPILSVAVGFDKAQNFSLGGAVVVQTIERNVQAVVDSGATLTAGGDIDISALDSDLVIASGAGVIATGKTAVGAAVPTNLITITVQAFVDGGSTQVTSSAGSVTLEATRTGGLILNLALGAEMASGFSLGGSVAANLLTITTDAHVTSGATVNGQTGVTIQATESNNSVVAAGGNYDTTNNSTSIGAAVALNDIQSDMVQAYVDGSTVESSAGAVTVQATRSDGLILAIGAAGENPQGTDANSVGGSAATNSLFTLLVDAHASNNASLHASGDITIAAAEEQGTTVAVAGNLDFSTSFSLLKSWGSTGQKAVAKLKPFLVKDVVPRVESILPSSLTTTIENAISTITADMKQLAPSGSTGGPPGLGSGGVVFGTAIALNLASNATPNDVTAYADSSTLTSTAGDVVITADRHETVLTVAGAGSAVTTSSLTVAAAVAVADVTHRTQAYISGSSMVTATQGNVIVAADSTVDFVTVGGNASFSSDGSSIAASSATTVHTDTTEAYIDDATITAPGDGPATSVVTGVAGEKTTDSNFHGLSVTATSEETVTTVAAGVAIATDAQVELVGSLSVNVLDETTNAYTTDTAILNKENAGADDDQEINVFADSATTIHGGGGSLGLSGGSGFGGGAGADIGDVTKHTEAYVEGDANANATLSVQAYSSEDIASYEGSIELSAGTSLAGALGTYILDLTTLAHIGDSAGDTSPNVTAGGVLVAADDVTDLDLFSGSLTASSGGVSIGGTVGISDLTKTTEAYIGPAATVTATGTEQFSAASGGIAVSHADPVAPATFTGSNVNAGSDEITLTLPSGLTLSDGDAVLFTTTSAPSGTSNAEKAIGGLNFGQIYYVKVVSGGNVVKLAASEDDLDNDNFIDLTAPSVKATEYALSTQTTVTDVQPPGNSVKDPAGNSIDDPDLTQVRSTNTNYDSSQQGVAVTATNRDSIAAIAGAGGLSSSTAVDVAALVNVTTSTTSAHIDGVASADSGDVLVTASNDYHQLAIGGTVAISGDFSGTATVDWTVAKLTTEAYLGGNSAVTTNEGDVLVLSEANEDLTLVAAGFAVSGEGALDATGAVLDLNTTTTATLAGTVTAAGNALVSAMDTTTHTTGVGAGAVGLGVTGIAASVGWLDLTKNTTAEIAEDANVTTHGMGGNGITVLTGEEYSSSQGGFPTTTISGLGVQAQSSEEVKGIVVTGAGGLSAFSGAAMYANIDSDTTAQIGDSATVKQTGEGASTEQLVNVSAANHVSALDGVGSVAIGGVEIAGGVDIGFLHNDTTAEIGSGAVVETPLDLDVNALSDQEVTSYAISAAVGGVGVAGAVSVWTLGTQYDANYTTGGSNPKSTSAISQSGLISDTNSQANRTDVKGALGTYASSSDSSMAGQQLASTTSSARTSVRTNTPTDVFSDAINNTDDSAVKALVSGGAVVNAGQNITIRATEDITLDVFTGGAEVGVVGAGASVGVANVFSGARAQIEGTLKAGKDVSVLADYTGDLESKGFAGSGGLAAIGAQVAIVNDSSDTTAAITGSAAVPQAESLTVRATRGYDKFETLAIEGQVGGLTAGAAVAQSRVTGTTTAYIGNAVIGGSKANPGVRNVTILSGLGENLTSNQPGPSEISASAYAVSAGIAAGEGNRTEVDFTPSVNASFGVSSGSPRAYLTGDLNIESAALVEPQASGFGVAAGGLAVGVTEVTANVSPTGYARITGNSIVHAGGAINLTADGEAVETNGITAATGQASGGGVISGDGANVTATFEPSVTAEIEGGATVTAKESVDIEAVALDGISAEATGITVGGLAVAVNLANLNISPTVNALIGDNATVTAGQAVIVNAESGQPGDLPGLAFDPAKIDYATNTITFDEPHGLQPGDSIFYDANGGPVIGGLEEGRAYTVLSVPDDNTAVIGRNFTPSQIDSEFSTIVFDQPPGFSSGDPVVYENNGNPSIGGLTDGQKYYVNTIDTSTIELAETQAQAETLGLVRFDAGTVSSTQHTFTVPPGSWSATGSAVTFQFPNDVNLSTNTITVPGHTFSTGDAVLYRTDSGPTQGIHSIYGLESGRIYYVTDVQNLSNNTQTLKLASTRIDAELDPSAVADLSSKPNGVVTNTNHWLIPITVDYTRMSIGLPWVTSTASPNLNGIQTGEFNGILFAPMNSGLIVPFVDDDIVIYDYYPTADLNGAVDHATIEPLVFGKAYRVELVENVKISNTGIYDGLYLGVKFYDAETNDEIDFTASSTLEETPVQFTRTVPVFTEDEAVTYRVPVTPAFTGEDVITSGDFEGNVTIINPDIVHYVGPLFGGVTVGPSTATQAVYEPLPLIVTTGSAVTFTGADVNGSDNTITVNDPTGELVNGQTVLFDTGALPTASFTASDVQGGTTHTITLPSESFPISAGDTVLFTSTAGSEPIGGLTAGQIYYVKSATKSGNDVVVSLTGTPDGSVIPLTPPQNCPDCLYALTRATPVEIGGLDLGQLYTVEVKSTSNDVRVLQLKDVTTGAIVSLSPPSDCQACAYTLTPAQNNAAALVPLVPGQTYGLLPQPMNAISLATVFILTEGDKFLTVSPGEETDASQLTTHQLAREGFGPLAGLNDEQTYYILPVTDYPGTYQLAGIPGGEAITIDASNTQGYHRIGVEGAGIVPTGSLTAKHSLIIDLTSTGATNTQQFFKAGVGEASFNATPTTPQVKASGSGGALVGVQGATATGKSTPKITASIGEDATVSGEDVEVTAVSEATIESVASGFDVGLLVGVGNATADTTINNNTTASVGSGSTVSATGGNGHGITVSANAPETSIATETGKSSASAQGGGLVDVATTHATTSITHQTTAEVHSNATLTAANGGLVSVKAEATPQGSASATSKAAGAGVGSDANATLTVPTSTVETSIQGGAELNGGEITVTSNLAPGPLTASATSDSSGAVGGGHADATVTVNDHANTLIAAATFTTQEQNGSSGDITFTSTFDNTRAQANADTHADVALGGEAAHPTVDINQEESLAAYLQKSGTPTVSPATKFIHSATAESGNDAAKGTSRYKIFFVPVTKNSSTTPQVNTKTEDDFAPSVDAGPDLQVNEGERVSLSGATWTAFDNPDNLEAEIDWGDGTIELAALVINADGSGGTLANTHTYVNNGVYTVTLTFTDSSAATAQDSLLVTALNVPPTIDSADAQITGTGLRVDLAVPFSNPGSADTHTASVDWGDGTRPVAATVIPTERGGVVNASHRYARPGTYTVTLTVTDSDGGSDTATFAITVPRENPRTGSVSGTLYVDSNANGSQDPGEPGLADQTIYADLNRNHNRDADEPADTTDAQGDYTLENLPLGAIDVRADLPGGSFVFTVPASGGQEVILSAAAPSAAGIDFGVQTVTPTINPTFPRSDLFTPTDGTDVNTEYVQGLYRTILGREADPLGLSVWVGLLPDPATVNPLTYQQARLAVADAIWTSFEHRGIQINGYYEDLLGRLPDPLGAAFWFTNLFYGSMTEEEVVEGILSSGEYQGRFSGDTAFLDELYADVLGRANASDPTLSYNAGPFAPLAQLQAGQSREEVILDVLYSDQTILRGIAGEYQAYLHRSTSGVSEQAYWLGIVRGSGRLRDAATGILSSDEFLGKLTGE